MNGAQEIVQIMDYETNLLEEENREIHQKLQKFWCRPAQMAYIRPGKLPCDAKCGLGGSFMHF